MMGAVTSVVTCARSGDTVLFFFFRNFFRRPSSTAEAKYSLNIFRRLITRSLIACLSRAEKESSNTQLSHTDSFLRLPVSLLTILAHLFLTNRVQQQVQITIAIMMPPATYKDTEIGRCPKTLRAGNECHRSRNLHSTHLIKCRGWSRWCYSFLVSSNAFPTILFRHFGQC